MINAVLTRSRLGVRQPCAGWREGCDDFYKVDYLSVSGVVSTQGNYLSLSYPPAHWVGRDHWGNSNLSTQISLGGIFYQRWYQMIVM